MAKFSTSNRLNLASQGHPKEPRRSTWLGSYVRKTQANCEDSLLKYIRKVSHCYSSLVLTFCTRHSIHMSILQSQRIHKHEIYRHEWDIGAVLYHTASAWLSSPEKPLGESEVDLVARLVRLFFYVLSLSQVYN